MALEAVARRVRAGQYPNLSLSIIVNDTGSGCGTNQIRVLSIAAMMFINSRVYCYIGPPCSGESTAAADLATYLNIPIVTATLPSIEFINKHSRFPTMTRTSYEMKTIIKVILSTLRHFQWSNFAFIYQFPTGNASVVLLDFVIPFPEFTENEFAVRYISIEEPDSLDAVLLSAIEKNRVIIIAARGELVRETMLLAYDMGLINGSYAFISIEPFSNTLVFGDDNWKQNNYFASAFHDAVILYSLAVNETLAEGGDIRDGHRITRKMWNRTFDGISGKVTINSNGDRDADYSLWDMTDTEAGTFEVIANYYGATGEFHETDVKPVWPNGATGPPKDEPDCGFNGEKCPPKPSGLTVLGVVGITASVIVIAAICALFLIYRKLRLDAELMKMSWRIKWEELVFEEIGKSVATATSGSRLVASRVRALPTSTDASVNNRSFLSRLH
ncbi:atrial natriuretic peptide receptor 3-like isoform X2 [Lytechinus pictus]|uniref:atrial natriuretic peptide receptor 3-like isoform X2 n=1 Tax=Lytechinus pictus TaxID=7653 RepID=UPI0030B9C4F3